jgi:hypothetical protein
MSIAVTARPVILVGKNNGVGLTCDAVLIRQALEGQREVFYCGPRALPMRGLLFNRDHLRDAIIIFIERIHAMWLPFGHRRVIIPNQERFPRRHLWRLGYVDAVLCKSRNACEIFSGYHKNAIYTGFTSPDNLDPSIKPDYNLAFHLAGKSTFKGTQDLLQVWERHPQWPLLTVVAHPNSIWDDSGAANIRMIKETLTREELVRLQNQCGIHICPSLAEGWGHYIVEGASCRALVVTTDAPPMNEHITEKRGCLIRSTYAGDRHMGRIFKPAPGALEECVQRVLGMRIAEREERGRAAREWYVRSNDTFADRLRSVLDSLDE